MMQVNSIIVNVFFGPLVNGARAIAIQMHNAVNSFSSSFLTAIKSPIIKSYSNKDYSHLDKIFDASNRFILYSLLIICIPLWLEMDTILRLWLSVNDNETVLYARLMIGYTFIMALNNPISFIIHATGHVKEYHTKVEIPTLLCIPATYLLFKMGCHAFVTFVSTILAALISHIIRMICVKKYYDRFSYRHYILQLLFPAVIIGLAAGGVSFFAHFFVDNYVYRFFTVFILSTTVIVTLAYFVGFSPFEKKMINNYLKLLTTKVLKNNE